MAQVVRAIILIVTALFPIVNPLGSAPLFLVMTSEGTPAERRTLAWKVSVNSFFLLLGSILIGTHILSFFGISLPIVQVGGGLVVISAGWGMLKRQDDEDRKQIQRTAGTGLLLRKAFYPLTLPLTVGPGSIAIAITLGANVRHTGGEKLLLGLLAAVVGALVISLCVLVCYTFAERIGKLLGPTAMSVVMRLSAFLLTCIGLQIVWNGLTALIHTL